MRHIKKSSLIALFIMAALPFSGLVGLPIAGATVLVGVAFFFVDKGRKPFSECGFDISSIGKAFSDKTIWLWMALPLVMDLVSVALAKLVLPDFTDHVLSRVAVMVSFDQAALMLLQLALFAIGEEIAWRAFFQNQMQRAMPVSLPFYSHPCCSGWGILQTGA